MKLITIDVIKETFDVAAVEGSSNSIQIYFKNTPDEWRDDSVGVFVLFAKGSKSQMFPIDKETMTTDILNNMLSENSGFKVTVFAMNSDTENPYKYVFPPIWVEVRQGYECDVSSAPDRDNMDAICVLLQVLMSYDEAEAERKANEEEREKKIADFDAEFSEYKNTVHNGEENYNPLSILAQSGKAVAQAVASIVNSAPETLNTLEELAAALGDDPNFATTVMNLIGNKTENRIFESAIGELQEDSVIHKSNQLNPHFVTKEQVGLGNVDNTADIDKPVSDAAKAELDKKVDKAENFGLTLMEPVPDEEDDSGYSWDKVYFENKPYIPGEDVTRLVEVYSVEGADKKFVGKVDGKGLSTNDFTDADKLTLTNTRSDMDTMIGEITTAKEKIDNKVDKEGGKGLSSNDFTDEEKTKLSNAAIDADLHKVAKSGLFSDLKDLPMAFNDLGSFESEEEILSALDDCFSIGIHTFYYRIENKSGSCIVFVTSGGFLGEGEYGQIVFGGELNLPKTRRSFYNWDTMTNEWNDWVDYFGEYVSKDYLDDTLDERLSPSPVTAIPTTLESNQQYNFGEVTELSLTFPTVANDGDVIYLTFYSGATPTTLTIDTTNTCDIEVIPESNTGYEIFGKYNGSIWIVNYSEYTVSEV